MDAPRVLVALIVALPLLGCRPVESAVDAHYRDAAGEAARWLATVEREGRFNSWPVSAESPDRVDPTLGAGVAGIALFQLAYARATGDGAALASALGAGRFLADTLPVLMTAADTARNAASLYAGLPGIAFTLNELGKAGRDSKLRSAAGAVLQRIVALAQAVDDGVEWGPYNDVLFGAAGTGLFLIYAAREMDGHDALALATRVGETLLERGERDGDRLTWRLRRDREIHLPNFSHGAAGVGYFLAALSDATGDPRFLDGAIAAGRYLESIARRGDGGFLVPYSVPNGQFDYDWDIGWAHGPAGTARLFYALYRRTGEEQWLDLTRQSVASLRASGLPGPPRAPFPEEPFRIDQRFGMAGVSEFLIDLYQATGDTTALSFGREVVDTILARSTVDSMGRRWTIPQYGFMAEPDAPATFTGYFYGAAGFGLALLRLDGALRGERWEPPFPDNPFESD